MIKHKKRITTTFLAILLMISIFFDSIFTIQVFAAQRSALQGNTPKEEVVYINLNADGSVKEINIVNIFDLNKKGKIIDYGKYENLRNMTTTDAIHYQNNMVTIDAGAGKLYYEGKLKENVMPWIISIKYFMNGKEYYADKMAGMSGKLEIKMSIRQNEKCDRSFFEGYALQAAFTLDTGKTANIVADGATMANVGSNKQLTYTILPGKGAEIKITADVTNFEMESVSINGVPLNLNIEVDDAELMERIAKLQEATLELDDGTGEIFDGVAELKSGAQSDLQNGVSELKDGAAQLYDGVSRLQDGGNSLQSGAADLKNGASSLDEGVNSLNNGIIQVQNALNALNAQSKTLKSGSSDFLENGITALQQKVSVSAYEATISGNNLDINALKNDAQIAPIITITEGYLTALSEAVNSLILAYQKLNGGIAYYTDAVDKITSNYSQVSDGAAELVAGSNLLVSGTQDLYSGTDELLSGITEVYDGTGTLFDGAIELDEGVAKLLDGITTLYDGTGELKDGTAAFREETAGMDAEIQDKIDELLKNITSGDMEIISFSSTNNTNIKSVQFVIKTDSVKIIEKDAADTEPEATLNFWQKLFKLFDLKGRNET